MKKRNFLTTAALAALVAAQMAMPIMAAPATNQIPAGSDQHTTIGIVEASSVSAAQASFDVPLYLVVAAVSGQGNIQAPTNYKISNKAATGGKSIGVTKMQIENLGEYNANSLATSAWAIVDGNNGSPTINNQRQIALQLGSLWMPSTVDKAKNEKVAVTFGANTFFQGTDDNSGKATYKPIEAGKDMDIPVNGQVQNTTRTDGKATSQFKVTYTVSPLDDNNQPLSAIYVGDDKKDAGLQ